MKPSLPSLLSILLFSFLLSACGPSTGPFGEYYVSPSGSDSSGDGSETRPWRTIQHALDNVSYDGETPPRINLDRGIYREDLRITRSVVIRGVGVADVFPSSEDPDLPTEVVSAIWRSLDIAAGGGHTISGEISVEFQDLVFYLGHVDVDGASALFQNVDFQDVIQHHGLQIHNSPLTRVLDSTFSTRINIASDLGIEIQNSTAVISNVELGRWFDHVINIGPDNVVTIEDSVIYGSSLGLADGIRIQGISEVNIIGNTIIRDHPSPDAPIGTPSGIEIAGWTTSRPGMVTIRGNEIQGFQTGIIIASEGNRVLIEGNSIDGFGHPITTLHVGYTGTSFPVVDLGGGSLGSSGGNVIGASGPYGFFHQGPWDADACNNRWLPADDAPARIYDREDNAGMGKINWENCGEAATGEESGEEMAETSEDPTPSPAPPTPAPPVVITDTLCWTGPGSVYDTVSSLLTGTVVEILGRGLEGDWWVIDNPRYPGVRCWTPGEDIEVDPGYTYPDTLYDPPPLPTPTEAPILGCLYQGPNDNEPTCYPIDSCPVPYENSLGACTP